MGIEATEDQLVYGAGTGISVPAHSVPWAAVYAADSRGKILEPDTPLFSRTTNPFRLYAVTVADTRYWQASSAEFELVLPIVSEQAQQLRFAAMVGSDETQATLRAQLLALAPEDPIAIQMGYAKKLFSDAPADIHDADVSPLQQSGPGYRMFFGYVDTIKVKLTTRGIKIVVQCRDSVRFLLDNKFTGQILGDNISARSSIGYRYTAVNASATSNPQEQELTLEEVQAAVTDASINPATKMVNEADTLVDQAGQKTDKGVSLQKHKVLAWLVMAGSNGLVRPAPFIPARSPEIDGPGFEISTRPVLVPTLGSAPAAEQAFTLINQVPMQSIKHYATMEAEPRELWADKHTGTICWRHRFTRRIDNPWAFTFLVNATSSTGELIARPNVLSAELDWSSVSLITEINIINPTAVNNASGSAQGPSGSFVVSGRLPDNRFFPDLINTAYPGLRNVPRRTRFVFDDTLNPSDNGQNGVEYARALLLNWGRDLRAGTINTVGCPQVQVGDAVRVYNHGFFQGDLFRVEAITTTFTANGPNKGFRSSLAIAQADEQRRYSIARAEAAMGESPTEGSRMFFGDIQTEKNAASRVGYSQTNVDFGERPEAPL